MQHVVPNNVARCCEHLARLLYIQFFIRDVYLSRQNVFEIKKALKPAELIII